MADPPRKPVLFINPRAGGGKAERSHLAEHASARGVEVVALDRGADLRALTNDAIVRGADALGVAGGDGSLAVVADVALTNDIPFVCIPAGTRNHFALDVGVDRRDVVGALDAFTEGVERRVDVARVNGHLFLNNVSLGIYGDAVQRPEYRDAKMRTLLDTAQAVLGPGDVEHGLHLVDDRGRAHRDPVIVVVSNNPYELRRPFIAGTRPTLWTGRLGVLVVDRPEDAARAGHEPGRSWNAKWFRIDADAPVQAGLDGESITLHAPLEFTIVPAALRVRISSRHPGVSPAGLVTR